MVKSLINLLLTGQGMGYRVPFRCAILALALCFPDISSGQSIRHEIWNGANAGKLVNLKNNPDFPDKPDFSGVLTVFEVGESTGDNYGTRISGFIIPPQTGEYLFFISGDDQCELFLSQDEDPANSRRIASVPRWTGFRQWNQFSAQKSRPVVLEAGKPYYIEALQAESSGGDHVSVGWELPDGTQHRPIAGAFLRPDNQSISEPEIETHPQSVSVTQGGATAFQVTATGAPPLQYQWHFNGNPLEEFREARFELFDIRPDWDGYQVYCRVSNDFGEVVSQPATLEVVSESVTPTISVRNPGPNIEVASVAYVEILFSEPVSGVDAGDLLVGGVEAMEVEGSGAGPYRFFLPELIDGNHVISLTANSGITDLAIIPNKFPGDEWAFRLDSSINESKIVISEINTVNPDGFQDSNGDYHDWIEIWNSGNTSVNLGGWALSDDRKNPGQWVFPDTVIRGGERLIVFASGQDRFGSELHTNFRLATGGEFLGLFRAGTPRPLVSQVGVDGEFPEQRSGFSYGLVKGGSQWGYFSNPTPGRINSSSITETLAPDPKFSVERGFFQDSFQLILHVDQGVEGEPEVKIRYTTDGSQPTLTRGKVFTAPITISKTATVRAIAIQDGSLPSRVVTHSYIESGPRSLLQLPIISISTDRSNLWGSTGIMETSPRNTVHRGPQWERPCSAEWIFPDGTQGFQVDCGLRVQGGNYVRGRYNPNGGLPFSKYSFRLYFRTDYGPGKLRFPLFPDTGIDEFDVVSLRAGMNDHSNPFVIDELARRLHSDMGYVASHGAFAHLFINGEYKGYYNPTERIDDNFLNSYAGEEKQWDVVAQFGETREGDRNHWNQMISAARKDQTNPANFLATSRLLDIDQFIDYLILNIYAGTGDWPHNNWRAARDKSANGKWKFLVWDAEWSFGNQGRSVTLNTLTSDLSRDSEITQIFQSLKKSDEFKLRFADRVQKHLYGDGALTRNRVRERFLDLVDEMRPVISGMNTTRASQWINTRPSIIEGHLSSRTQNLYTPDIAPEPSLQGGKVARGEFLSLSSVEDSTIYYTVDGGDPRVSPLNSVKSVNLISEGDRKWIFVPNANNDPDGWQGDNEPFDHSDWTSGKGGVGYDTQPTYREHIGIDTLSQMRSKSPNCYIRIPFQYTPGQVEGDLQLVLQARFDDGFEAYLNGVKILSRGVPNGELSWNSISTSSHSDARAIQLNEFDISEYIDELKPGLNVLAVRGMNVTPTSSDFLFSASMSLGSKVEGGGKLNPSAVEFTQPLVIDRSMTVNARALIDGDWSPLTSLDYQVTDQIYQVRISEIMYHSPHDPEVEWIEITNFSGREIDLSQWTLEGAGYQFPHGEVLDAGSSLVLVGALGAGHFAEIYPGVTVRAEFSGTLSNKGESLRLRDASGRIMDEVQYGDNGAWPERADGGGASIELSGAASATGDASSWRASSENGGSPGVYQGVPGSLGNLIISELAVMPAAESLDPLIRPADWVELQNISSISIDLKGWSISDKSGLNTQWVIQDSHIVPPGEFVTIGLGGVLKFDGASSIAAPFSLNRNGEAFYLFDPDGVRVDGTEFGFMPEGYSLARFSSGFHLGEPTPGEENLSAVTGDISSIRFNEWYIFPVEGESPWIELTSIDPMHPVALKGLVFEGNGWSHQIRHNAWIAPDDFIVFRLEQELGWGELPSFPMTKGDSISLSHTSGVQVDNLRITLGNTGYSYGLLPDGTGSRKSFGAQLTPGLPNPVNNPATLIISEFMAWDPVPSEASKPFRSWIEIRNDSDVGIDFNRFSIRNEFTGDVWQNLEPYVIEPGGFAVVGMDPFIEGDILLVSGWYNSTVPMSGQGGAFQLLDPSGDVIDSILFGPQISGKSVAPGTRYSLLKEATPGMPNSDSASMSSGSKLAINEWRARHNSQRDWFEVFNSDTRPADLSRFNVADNPYIYEDAKVSFPSGSFVDAGGWARFFADRSRDREPWAIPFQISGDGEMLRIYSLSNKLIDQVAVLPTLLFETYGRIPDGGDEIGLLIPTPSASNLVELPVEMVDSDGDGMPDIWEMEYDLDPFNPYDAFADNDNDGVTNLVEFQSGGSPHVKQRILTIQSELDTSGDMRIFLVPTTGSVYVLEHANALSENGASWEELNRSEPAANNQSVISFVVTPVGEHHFFRVREINP